MTTIYVGNLPFSATEDEVRSLFESHGKVESVKIIMDRETGRPRGFAFVEMSSSDAQTAIAQTNGTIAGVVKDATGAVMPGVTVEAASPVLIEKSRSVTTDNDGQYKIIDLRPGTYTVTVTDVNSCQSNTSTTITVKPLPTPSITVAETSGTTNNEGTICSGSSATLTAAGGGTYSWSDLISTQP